MLKDSAFIKAGAKLALGGGTVSLGALVMFLLSSYYPKEDAKAEFTRVDRSIQALREEFREERRHQSEKLDAIHKDVIYLKIRARHSGGRRRDE